MTNTIRFKRGTKAAIDAIALKGGLLEGEPLYFTDLKTVGIAITKTTYELMTKGHWAGKYGPSSFIASYKNAFAVGRGYGDSMDFSTYNYGIEIKVTGQYEVRATQRGKGTGSPYVAVAVNGDRSALENRTSGIWTHDHTPDLEQFSEASYIGLLNAGEIITAGQSTSVADTNISYGANSYNGTLIIKRLS